MFKKFFLLISLLYAVEIVALPTMLSPQPACATVLPNGDITITWSTPTDPGLIFNSYRIYSSNSASGPFVLLDSVFTYAQTSYTHIGANGNLASRYYYIQTRYNNGGQVNSPALDTVRSIYLNVINPVNGTAIISWNPIATPSIATSTGIYNIYQEYPAGVWAKIGTTSNLNFIDTIFICNDTINYRVEIADNTGCSSISSIAGGKFQNIIVPAIPGMDTLSVDDFNNAMMNWNVNPSPDVAGYVIYRLSGAAKIPVDTVLGINNTSYNYLLSIADIMSEGYFLAAFDTCGNISPLGPVFKTIYLTSESDICNRSVILDWTPYTKIGTGLEGYRIYQSSLSQAGPYTLIGGVPAGTLTFTASNLAPNTSYYYKVEAYDLSGTKTVSSNRIIFYSATPVPPVFSYLRKATVLDPNRVNLSCHVDVAASTLKYKIMRSTDNLNFVNVGTVPAKAVTPILYSDTKVLTDKYSYYYKIINVDSCGYDGLETNVARTILLKAIGNSDNMTNTLTWNDYEGWSGKVLSYNIYRGIDGVMGTAPIANVLFNGSGSNTFTDDVSPLLQGQGVFNYYVEALEDVGNIYGFSEISLSNIAEAYQDPLIHIPNAFHPDEAYNPIFIPVTTYVDLQEYQFEIYNRWGEQMFITTDITVGWNGTYKGKPCEFGVFVYILRLKTSKGEYIQHKGSVTLLR